MIIASEWASLQAAIYAAAVETPRGGVVLVDGEYVIDAPLILPRSGLSPTRVVHLVGESHFASVIRGSGFFPPGRALIEWEAQPIRTQEQVIENLALDLPYVSGVRAIHYKLTAGKSFAEQNAERLHIRLENLHIRAHNDYHPELIYLEGSVNRSIIRNITADPGLGSGTYATLLLKTDTVLPNDYDILGDMSGLMWSDVSNLYGMVRRGGKSRVFEGRLHGGTFRTAFGDNAGAGPSFHFVNSIKAVIEDISTEGRFENAQYRFTNCRWLSCRSLNVGTPDDGVEPDHVGIELINCLDCTFDSRAVHVANPAFSSRQAFLIWIDEGSKRNVFSRIGIKSGANGPAGEVVIVAPPAAGNAIGYIDAATGQVGVLT